MQPATLAFARAREPGLLTPDDLVRDHLPEFAGGGRDAIAVRHPWNRTAPVRAADRAAGSAFDQGRDAPIALIRATGAGPGRVPGQRAA
ncbi:serine hydrolase [Streptomyces sp. MMG1121]|uniref:serine hydrolase n=1 Tax=Streptomyces sp. MMG1121 TaxID=1415544 RepID=UPI0006AF29D8|nr:serine hydrolase [Streptomyces sp. MMG1121]KOV68727.1 hypothetical protein ADK64_06855 [Streptomyces sp. MMG1121]